MWATEVEAARKVLHHWKKSAVEVIRNHMKTAVDLIRSD